MNRRDFLKTAGAGLGALVSACVGWTRVSASSWSSEAPVPVGANWSSGPARQPDTGYRVPDVSIEGIRTQWEDMTKSSGIAVPIFVAGDGHFIISATLIGRGGEETVHTFSLPKVRHDQD